jgi:hypothetical protein
VGGHELVELRGLARIARAGGHRQQQIAEVLARGDREEFQRIDDHVGVAAVGQMVLDGHAVRIGRLGAVRQVGDSRGIGEAHGHRNLAAVEQHRLAQGRRVRRGREAALGHQALGVIGAEAGMDAEGLVHGIHDRGLDGLIVRPREVRRCQAECGQRGQEEVSSHGGLPLRAATGDRGRVAAPSRD